MMCACPHSVPIEFLVDLCLRQAFPRRKAAKIGKNEGFYVFTLFSGPAAQEGAAATRTSESKHRS